MSFVTNARELKRALEQEEIRGHLRMTHEDGVIRADSCFPYQIVLVFDNEKDLGTSSKDGRHLLFDINNGIIKIWNTEMLVFEFEWNELKEVPIKFHLYSRLG